jgi:hypothetical protein
MKCPHCGKEVRIRFDLHMQEFPGVEVEEGVTPVVGKIVPCDIDLLPNEPSVGELLMERERRLVNESAP